MFIPPTLILCADLCSFMTYNPSYISFTSRLYKSWKRSRKVNTYAKHFFIQHKKQRKESWEQIFISQCPSVVPFKLDYFVVKAFYHFCIEQPCKWLP